MILFKTIENKRQKMQMVSEIKEVMLNCCSLAKSLLMILVVLGHSCLFFGGSWISTLSPVIANKPLGYFAMWLNSFHIYAFVLISGYLFYYLKFEILNPKYHNIHLLIVNKAKRLLVPLIAFSVLWIIPLSFAFGVFNENTDIMKKFFLGYSPSQLWFLLMLFWVFILAYVLSSLWAERTYLGLLITLAIYGAGIVGSSLAGTFFQFFPACIYLFLFFIGFKIRQKDAFQNLLLKIPILVYIFIDVSLFVFLSQANQYDFYLKNVVLVLGNMLLHVWGGAGAFIVLFKLLQKIKTIQLIAQRMQKYSMPVYLLHQQIIYAVIVLANGYINPCVHALLNFVVSIALSVAISEFLLRFRLSRFLMGEK